jgi:hypothetical protein
MVLQAIQDTKIDMTIWPAICEWEVHSKCRLDVLDIHHELSQADHGNDSTLIADIDSNETANAAQVKAVEDSLKTYGTDHVEGVSHPIPCHNVFTCSRYPVRQVPPVPTFLISLVKQGIVAHI